MQTVVILVEMQEYFQSSRNVQRSMNNLPCTTRSSRHLTGQHEAIEMVLDF